MRLPGKTWKRGGPVGGLTEEGAGQDLITVIQ